MENFLFCRTDRPIRLSGASQLVSHPVAFADGGCPFQGLEFSVHLGEHFLELLLRLRRSTGAGQPTRNHFPLPAKLHQPLESRLKNLRLFSGHVGTCGWVPCCPPNRSGLVMESAPLGPFSKHISRLPDAVFGKLHLNGTVVLRCSKRVVFRISSWELGSYGRLRWTQIASQTLNQPTTPDTSRDRSAARNESEMENKLMKRNVGFVIALLMLATGLSVPLPAQQPTPEKSDLIDSSAMDALNQMGTYLRSLRDFQVKANVTSEDVSGGRREVDVRSHHGHACRSAQ